MRCLNKVIELISKDLAIIILVGLLVPGCKNIDYKSPTLPEEPLEYTPVKVPAPSLHFQNEIAGEVTQNSVILHARLTVDGKVKSGDVKGRTGLGAFALSTKKNFQDALRTRWMPATPENDYIIKIKVTCLKPGTRYYYRLLSGQDPAMPEAGPTGTFRTLDKKGVPREVSFVAVTGMNQFSFKVCNFKKDAKLGFPALKAIVSHNPDFLVATGDNVYYDSPYIGRAKTEDKMRAKWHRQFATPRFAALFQNMSTYWEKDDHDHRYNDSDPCGEIEPSHELSARIFIEQVPVVDLKDKTPVTYRTHRINDLLQIWLLEGRDYRDPNTKAPGPDKTMWGSRQKAWLKKTLLESTATFKILISPTPLIGPDDTIIRVQGGILAPFFGGNTPGQGDDRRKRDNHTNPYGFKDEGEEFFAWLSANGFLKQNFYIICGDRHWQYHSKRPDGFEEFSTGAIVDRNSRLGRKPGDPLSTDPEGLITQPHIQNEKSGGFLKVTIVPSKGELPAWATFTFYDELGTLLYSTKKTAHQE